MRKICPFTVAAAASWPASEDGWPQPPTRVFTLPVGAMVDPSQLMMNAKDLPAAEFVDHIFLSR